LSERILVVEDEESIARILVDAFEARGYQVTWLDHGDLARERLAARHDDLVLLDVMLPGISGFDLLRGMRKAGNQAPVIMLTAKGSEPDRVLGFELGVDDYVTKPFSVLELLGRVKAVLRRVTPEPVSPAEPVPPPVPATATIGPAVFDFRRLTVDGGLQAVTLSAKGFAVMEVLYGAKGNVVSRDALIDRVWGADDYINTRTIDNIIVRLRQLIELDPAEPRYLRTVYGVGYQLFTD
jgi:DNA-binding response OmpR family regulator